MNDTKPKTVMKDGVVIYCEVLDHAPEECGNSVRCYGFDCEAHIHKRLSWISGHGTLYLQQSPEYKLILHKEDDEFEELSIDTALDIFEHLNDEDLRLSLNVLGVNE